MMDEKNNPETPSADTPDALLQKLLYLKGYERPDMARMVRNRQNIMRCVREVNSRKRVSLSGLLEMNIPWFFAEPRYGIAALFVIFATLQFWGVSAQKQGQDKTGFYLGESSMALTEQSPEVYTNSTFPYPEMPSDFSIFPDRSTENSVKFVGRRIDPDGEE